MEKTTSRRTSKLFLLANTGLAWGLAFFGVYAQQGTAVVASCLALIGSLYGAYVGIGHLDYRRFLSFFSNAEGASLADAIGTETLEIASGGGDDTGPDYGFIHHRTEAVSSG